MLNSLLRRIPSIAAALPFAVLVPAGCGDDASNSGGTGGSASPAGSVELEQFPAAAASALCDNLGSCCSQYGFTYDGAACKAAYEAAIQEQVVDSIQSGPPRIAYDPAAAGECVRLTRTAVIACGPTDAAVKAMNDACAAAVRGLVAEGHPCNSDFECAAGPDGPRSCLYAPPPALGEPVCQTVQSGGQAKGEPCGMTCGGVLGACSGTDPGAGDCYISDGLYCDSVKLTCEEVPGDGEACADAGWCADRTLCIEGTCKAYDMSGLGEACAEGYQCESGRCTNQKCAPENLMASSRICAGDI